MNFMDALGLGRCEWSVWAGGRRRGGAGRRDSGRKEKEQSCSLGQIFCCFIRFSVNQLEFARTGGRRGVLKR